MDKAFWYTIIENEYAVPAGYSVATLTPELLSLLGSIDPQLREKPAYEILTHWVDLGHYTHTDQWKMVTQLLHNLTTGLGTQQDDTVFLRSFSVLILTEIVYYDLTHPAFSASEIQQILEQTLAYFQAENDLRGYIPEKGWAHAIAHTGDLLMVLARYRFVPASDLERIMSAIAEKIVAPVAHVYLYDEDGRLVRPVMSALQRDLLTLPFLTTWLEQLTRERVVWNDDKDGKSISVAETCARHNAMHFLRSLYFQLRTPGFADITYVEQRPPIANELLPLVENALSQIHVWC